MPTKKPEPSLLEQLSENPDLIGELDRDQLADAKTQLADAVKTYVAGVRDRTSDDPTADMAAAREAKQRLEAVDEALEVIAKSDAELDAEAEALLEGLEETVEEPVEAETEEVVELEVEETVTDEEIAEVIESETVTAATTATAPTVIPAKPSVGKLAERTPRPPVLKKALVASAGPGISSQYRDGFTNPNQLGEGALKLWNSYGKTSKVDAKAVVASFDTSQQYKYEVTGDERHDGEIIDQLVKEVRKEARQNPATAALVASGGVCAPAQPVYDFFSIVDTAGMIQLPTVAAPRGRLTYPVSPSYATVRSTAAWDAAVGNQHTNTEDVEGATKPNYTVTCPDTTTCTIDAYSTILGFGNFQQRFYPEEVANAISLSAAYAAHKVNAALIAVMVAASTAAGGGDTGGGGLVNVANLIGFEAAKYRDNYRMDFTAPLDLISPAWVLDALVADLVARNSTTSFENARGRVLTTFASLNLNLQLVQDWQSIGDANDGGFRPAADFLLYAPGTFVRMDEGRLDLGIVRDSTLNATNDFQVFSESFEQVCEIGHDSVLIDDVTICPRGSAGIDVALDCNPGYNS